tara:strand:- start:39 stop:1091 length:1053 start_codon:yes stop_codon:yes gene_type:complete
MAIGTRLGDETLASGIETHRGSGLLGSEPLIESYELPQEWSIPYSWAKYFFEHNPSRVRGLNHDLDDYFLGAYLYMSQFDNIEPHTINEDQIGFIKNYYASMQNVKQGLEGLAEHARGKALPFSFTPHLQKFMLGYNSMCQQYSTLRGVVDGAEDDEKDMLGGIKTNADSIIKDTSDRIRSAKVNEYILLRSLVDDIFFRYQQKAAELGIEFSQMVPNVMVNTDYRPVLSNLVGNAVKHMKPEGEKHVYVFAEETGDGLVCNVIDNGVGIPQEDQGKIFSPDFSDGNRMVGKGSGLGLPTARSYVDAYHGTLCFVSTLGEGSQFYFTIPMASQGIKQAERSINGVIHPAA